MAQQVIAGGAQIRLIWNFGATNAAVNVLNARQITPLTFNQALADTLLTAFKSSMTSSGHGAQLNTQFSLAQVGIRNLNLPNEAEFLSSGAAQAGTGTGDPLPRMTCYVVKLRTAKAGPSFRGRVYLWGYAEGVNTTNGLPDPTVGTAALAFINAIKANLATSQLALAIFSRPRDAKPNEIPPVPAYPGALNDVASQLLGPNEWRTQRRRMVAGI